MTKADVPGINNVGIGTNVHKNKCIWYKGSNKLCSLFESFVFELFDCYLDIDEGAFELSLLNSYIFNLV